MASLSLSDMLYNMLLALFSGSSTSVGSSTSLTQYSIFYCLLTNILSYLFTIFILFITLYGFYSSSYHLIAHSKLIH